jgi:hypothetical protein
VGTQGRKERRKEGRREGERGKRLHGMNQLFPIISILGIVHFIISFFQKFLFYSPFISSSCVSALH